VSKKVFPIKTTTACQLKWIWSTVYLTEGHTASCHRTNHHSFDFESFNFHNTDQKIKDRQRMLNGQWPEQGCDDCRNIELAGGASDRITNLNFWEFDAPKELQLNPIATTVTPRILEIYFNNTCNLKCTYCGPEFSSLWADELKRFDGTIYQINENFDTNKQKLFDWLTTNINELHQLNILGGEPLYQPEFDQLLDVLERNPAPQLTLTFFSNLAVAQDKLVQKIDRIERLKEQGYIKKLIITASLDCWGDEQEFARFPLSLKTWEKNFNYILNKNWINIVIGSTITPLTIKTLPILMEKINEWNVKRPVYWYGNTSEDPGREFDFGISMFGNIFEEDFNRAIDQMPEKFEEHISVKNYLKGIRDMVKNSTLNLTKIEKFYTMLEQFDQRRNTNWRSVYPWLVELFKQHLGKD
jgi:organic radical activating enzyme